MTTRDTAWAPGTPCWADLTTTDPLAARDFYRGLFGWDVEVGGDDTHHYAMCSVDGRVVAGINGLVPPDDHPPAWITYLAADDAEQTARAATAAGATVFLPVIDVLDLGRMGLLAAPGSGAFGLWQAGTHIGFGVANEPGSVTWNEFMTRDDAGAQEFLAGLFGCTYTELFPGYSSVEIDGNTVAGIGTLAPEVPGHVPPHWRLYFQVTDADAAVARVVELGGSVQRPATDLPYGRHADVLDPQGARFTVIKPAPRAQ